DALPSSEDAAHMRAEELVWRAGQESAVQGAAVNGPVRRVMHGIEEHERPGGMRQLHNLFHGIDCSDGVRRVANGNQFGARSYLSPQVVQIKRAILLADVRLAYDHAALFEGAPGGDVGVMVERGDYDFISRRKLAPDGARQRKGNRSHVRAEEDFVCAAIQEVCHGYARGGNNDIDTPAGAYR